MWGKKKSVTFCFDRHGESKQEFDWFSSHFPFVVLCESNADHYRLHLNLPHFLLLLPGRCILFPGLPSFAVRMLSKNRQPCLITCVSMAQLSWFSWYWWYSSACAMWTSLPLFSWPVSLCPSWPSMLGPSSRLLPLHTSRMCLFFYLAIMMQSHWYIGWCDNFHQNFSVSVRFAPVKSQKHSGSLLINCHMNPGPYVPV